NRYHSSAQILYEKLPRKSRFNELYYVSQRVLRNLSRSPIVIIIQIGISVVFAILCGCVFFRVDHTLDQGVKKHAGAIFLVTVFQVLINLIALELFLKERALFIHVSVLRYELFFEILYKSYKEVHALSVTRLFRVASVILGMTYVIMIIFSGFIVDLKSIVGALNWMQWFSILRYALYGLNVKEFTNLKLCAAVANNATSICSYRGEDIVTERHIVYESDWDL
ncbi:unnamed protein product, partial [Didymodactylos carnosus]